MGFQGLTPGITGAMGSAGNTGMLVDIVPKEEMDATPQGQQQQVPLPLAGQQQLLLQQQEEEQQQQPKAGGRGRGRQARNTDDNDTDEDFDATGTGMGAAGGKMRSNALDTAGMDPRRAKRILANRQSAQRSRMKRLQHVHDLENQAADLNGQIKRLQGQLASEGSNADEATAAAAAAAAAVAALQQQLAQQEGLQAALQAQIVALRTQAAAAGLMMPNGAAVPMLPHAVEQQPRPQAMVMPGPVPAGVGLTISGLPHMAAPGVMVTGAGGPGAYGNGLLPPGSMAATVIPTAGIQQLSQQHLQQHQAQAQQQQVPQQQQQLQQQTSGLLPGQLLSGIASAPAPGELAPLPPAHLHGAGSSGGNASGLVVPPSPADLEGDFAGMLGEVQGGLFGSGQDTDLFGPVGFGQLQEHEAVGMGMLTSPTDASLRRTMSL